MKDIVVSEVQILPVKPKDGLVAFASCVINDQFYVGDIAIYTRPDGSDYRLVYPCKVLPNGMKINCFHPINRAAADRLKNEIVKVFSDLIEKVEKMKREGECVSAREG